MSLGTISTLGLGSGGILNNDLVDKLKNADKATLVTPLENKKKLAESKKTELAEIKSTMLKLSTAVTNMTYDTTYDTVKKDISGDSVAITTTGAVKEQNFSIDVSKLATKDIFQATDGFKAKDSSLEAGDMKISIGSGDDKKDFTIDIASGDTLEKLVENINKNTDGKVEASILNVGGDNPYKLIIKSAQTGEKNQLTISSTSNSFSNDFSRIGDPAQDASFTVDGVEVTRSTNKVDDLIDNITINLEKEGKSDISIKKDSSKIVEGIKDFVEKYNDMVKKLTEDTKFDKTKKTAGIFQNNTQIKEIRRTLQDIIATTVSKDKKTANDFGIDLQRDGTIVFDETKFQKEFDSNTKTTVEFFKASNATDGLLTN